LDAGLDRFDIIKQVRFQLITTNDEADNNGLFEVRELKNQAGAATSELVHYNDKGLSKDGTRQQIKAAAAEGNTEVKIIGNDNNGDSLVLSNEELKAHTPFAQSYGTIVEATRYMFASFTDLLKRGTLTVEAANDDANRKVEEIRQERLLSPRNNQN